MANNSILSYIEVDRMFKANGKAGVAQETVKEE